MKILALDALNTRLCDVAFETDLCESELEIIMSPGFFHRYREESVSRTLVHHCRVVVECDLDGESFVIRKRCDA